MSQLSCIALVCVVFHPGWLISWSLQIAVATPMDLCMLWQSVNNELSYPCFLLTLNLVLISYLLLFMPELCSPSPSHWELGTAGSSSSRCWSWVLKSPLLHLVRCLELFWFSRVVANRINSITGVRQHKVLLHCVLLEEASRAFPRQFQCPVLEAFLSWQREN